MAQYTTTDLVQYELQAISAFSGTTLPSITTVTDWITEESAQIDSNAGTVF